MTNEKFHVTNDFLKHDTSLDDKTYNLMTINKEKIDSQITYHKKEIKNLQLKAELVGKVLLSTVADLLMVYQLNGDYDYFTFKGNKEDLLNLDKSQFTDVVLDLIDEYRIDDDRWLMGTSIPEITYAMIYQLPTKEEITGYLEGSKSFPYLQFVTGVIKNEEELIKNELILDSAFLPFTSNLKTLRAATFVLINKILKGEKEEIFSDFNTLTKKVSNSLLRVTTIRDEKEDTEPIQSFFIQSPLIQ